jgi:hypothetical protein
LTRFGRALGLSPSAMEFLQSTPALAVARVLDDDPMLG